MAWTGEGCEFKDGKKMSTFRGTSRLLLAGSLYSRRLGWSQGRGSHRWVGEGAYSRSAWVSSVSMGCLPSPSPCLVLLLLNLQVRKPAPLPQARDRDLPGSPETSSSSRPSCPLRIQRAMMSSPVSSRRTRHSLGKGRAILSLWAKTHIPGGFWPPPARLESPHSWSVSLPSKHGLSDEAYPGWVALVTGLLTLHLSVSGYASLPVLWAGVSLSTSLSPNLSLSLSLYLSLI